MPKQITFRFNNQTLNKKLLALFKKYRVTHSADKSGTIRYSPKSEEFVQNELIAKVRGTAFPSWQLISCPNGWAQRYKDYILQHDIPFHEEVADNELWFLIPRNYRPHAWVLEESHSVVH